MLNRVIAFALKNRPTVLLASVALLLYGAWELLQMPVDVLPDLNRPTVVVMTEAPGLAPEEVEILVTKQLETLLHGALGVQRVRSASAFGLSVVWVEFDWGSDIHRDRQIVAEKLQLARDRLPPAVQPVLAPVSSIMGEIMLLGLRLRTGPRGGLLAPLPDPNMVAELLARPDGLEMTFWETGAAPRTANRWTQRSVARICFAVPVGVAAGHVLATYLQRYFHEATAGEGAPAALHFHLPVNGTPRQITFPSQLSRQMHLRSLAEFRLRQRLLAVSGVSQVTVMGGVLRQYQIITSPGLLAAGEVSLPELLSAAGDAHVLFGGGVQVRGAREYVIRITGQMPTLEEIGETPVRWRWPVPVRIRDVAEPRFGGPIRRGDGGVRIKEGGRISGGPAVIIAVQKQPHADTLTLDRLIDEALAAFESELPADAALERRIFRQADFINAAVDNVFEALQEGALWVVLVLFLFLWNFRVGIASLTALPVSILLTFLVFRWFGVSINTMTLGGIAVAIGELVDDSIVDAENIFRRLKENRLKPNPDNPLRVVFLASAEVRNSIVYATLIVVLVVAPLFALSGLEGRIFAPLGFAYVTSLLVSLVVALTLTPVLASFLLPRARILAVRKDSLALRVLKGLAARVVPFTLRHANAVLAAVGILVVLSCLCLFWMGGEFLPPFNEGTLTVNVQTASGTSLERSTEIALRMEDLLLEVPEVVSVSRRTGRAELDEHAEGVNVSELDVTLMEDRRRKPGWFFAVLRKVPIAHLWGYEKVGRPREQVLADVRDRLTRTPKVDVNIGQPISHRLDHVLTGVRAQIVVKLFGDSLQELREKAHDVAARMTKVPGVVDLQVERQEETPQLQLVIDRAAAARHGLTPGAVGRLLEAAYKGRVVGQIVEGEAAYDLVVWFDEASRNDPEQIRKTILVTPSGARVKLGDVVQVRANATGPSTIYRDNVERRIAVSCNVEGRDLAGVVADVKRQLAPLESEWHGRGDPVRLELGGQFEAQQQANRRLLVLGTAAVLGVFLLLCRALRSWRAAVQVLANIPLAAIGAVVALLLTNWPDAAVLAAAPWWRWPLVWMEATHLSLAHWVGFITLVGIVSRNGIMMISHYQHLMRHEGETFSQAMILRGTQERLAPVLMTALTTFMGLLPLLFGAGQSGKEILHPLAVVVFGGMVVSTLLDQLVTPALFWKFGKKVVAAEDAGGTGGAGEAVRLAEEQFPK